MSPQIENIIIKYLTHCASARELDILEIWIEIPENKLHFQNYVKTNYLINYKMNDPDTEREVEELLKRIRRAKSLKYRFKSTPYMRYAAAAVIVGILVGGYFIKEHLERTSGIQIQPIIVDNAIKPGTDKATLTLEDGSIVTLGKGTSFQSKNARSNGEEIFYSDEDSGTTEIAYNYLTVPRGGQFFLSLEDGTRVWLNSESKLKYPVAFKKGDPRTIELIYGEAYFDVSPSAGHNGSQFQVFHAEQSITVLGTEFNIKAYGDEQIIYTTLVEGKVSLAYGGNAQNLLPNQQFQYNVQNETTLLSEVNVFDVVSWKEGIFSFDHTSLLEIMKVLERWYDMEVTFEDDGLKEVLYSGSINKKYRIEEILTALMETKTIQTYKIKERTIILK